MSYLPQRVGIVLTQVLGWGTVALFSIAAVVSIPSGNGIVGLLGCVAVAICPGAAFAFGARSAFEGDTFWYKVVLGLYGLLGVGFGAFGFASGEPALLLIYPFLLVPPIVLVSAGKPTTDGEINARKYVLIAGGAYAATAMAAWVIALLG